MIVTSYYHITRTKLALEHAGVRDIEQAHSGVVEKDDAFMIARETIAFYYYLGKFYLLPAAENARQEAGPALEKVKQDVQADSNKLKSDAGQAKDKVQQDLHK
jgi:hypothetical protein